MCRSMKRFRINKLIMSYIVDFLLSGQPRVEGIIILYYLHLCYLQCFDAVGWAAGRACCL